MAGLDEPGDEPNFDLFGSFGVDFFSDDEHLFCIFCSRIINLSFNGLNILFIVNVIFTGGVTVFLNTLTKKIEANCKITIFFVVE